MNVEELAMQFIIREYSFNPKEWGEDSLGNDPETGAAYYAFIAGYEAATAPGAQEWWKDSPVRIEGDPVAAPRVITRVMDDGIQTKDGAA